MLLFNSFCISQNFIVVGSESRQTGRQAGATAGGIVDWYRSSAGIRDSKL